MIAFRKTGRVHWLACNTPQPFFLTAQQKKSLSDIAQRAVWASSIITLISKCNNRRFQNVPLRKIIKGLEIQSQSYVFNQQYGVQIKDMFENGVKLREEFSSQQDIISGTSNQTGLFVFGPNYTVTKPIFSCLTDLKSSYFISGEYGIGKTVSFALYQHLSPFIHQFVFQSLENPILQQELTALETQNLLFRYPKCWYWNLETDIFKEPDSLKEYIIKQTIQLPEITRKQLMLALDEDQLIARLNKIYKKANIQRMAIIDEVDIAASSIRNWNNIVKEWKIWQMTSEDLSNRKRQTEEEYDERITKTSNKTERIELLQEKYKKIEEINNERQKISKLLKNRKMQGQQYEKAKSMIDKFSRFRKIGVFNVIASPIDLEREILRDCRVDNQLSLDFFRGQDVVKSLHINFHKSIKEQPGKTDFLDVFLFQIGKRLPKSKEIYQLLEENGKQFFQLTTPDMFKGYFSIEFARQFIDQQFTKTLSNKFRQYQKKQVKDTEILSSKPKNLSDSSSNYAQISFEEMGKNIQAVDQAIRQILRLPKQENPSISQKLIKRTKSKTTQTSQIFGLSVLQSFDEMCQTKNKKMIKNLIGSDSQKKKLFILQTFYHIAKLSRQFGYNTLSFSTLVYNQLFECSTESLFLDQDQLLPVVYQDDFISFDWTAEQFIKFTKDFVEPELDQFYQSFVDKYTKRFLEKNKGSEDRLFLFAILQIMSPKAIIQFTFFDKNNAYQTRRFAIHQKDRFRSFRAAQLSESEQKSKKSRSNAKKNLSKSDNSQQEKVSKAKMLKDAQQLQQSLLQNFKSVLKEAKRNKGKEIFANPYKCTFKNFFYKIWDDFNSPVIDFAIVQFNKNDQFEIFTFEVVTANDSEAIQDKRNKAFAFFKRLARDPFFIKDQPMLKHIILCKQRFCLAEEVHPSFTIVYSPYEAISVIDYPQAQLQQYLFFMIYRIFMDKPTMALSDLAFRDKKLEQTKKKEQ